MDQEIYDYLLEQHKHLDPCSFNILFMMMTRDFNPHFRMFNCLFRLQQFYKIAQLHNNKDLEKSVKEYLKKNDLKLELKDRKKVKKVKE